MTILNKPKLSFLDITLSKLQNFFDIEIIYGKEKFEEWFGFAYQTFKGFWVKIMVIF